MSFVHNLLEMGSETSAGGYFVAAVPPAGAIARVLDEAGLRPRKVKDREPKDWHPQQMARMLEAGRVDATRSPEIAPPAERG